MGSRPTMPAPVPRCEIHDSLMTMGAGKYSRQFVCTVCLKQKEMDMLLEDIIDKDAVLEAAFQHPALALGPRKMPPDLDTALKCVVSAIEDAVIESTAEQVKADLNEQWETYTLINGDYTDVEADRMDDFTSGVDDMIEKLCEPYSEYLSQDWLGKNTIECEIWEEGAIDKFALRLGKEYYNNLVHQYGDSKGKGSGKKSPAQIMSSAAIMITDVEARLAQHLTNQPQPKKEETTMSNETTDIQGVLEKMFEHLGKDYDRLTVHGDIDLVADDDDLLAKGSAARLGIDENDIETVRNEVLEHGRSTADVLEARLYDVSLKPAKPKGAKPAAKPKTEKPAKGAVADTKAKRKQDEAQHAEPDTEVSISVLAALKECGADDAKVGEALGLSRATYNGYANGKKPFTPTAQQRDVLRAEIVERINKLGEALTEFDGTPVDPVF